MADSGIFLCMPSFCAEKYVKYYNLHKDIARFNLNPLISFSLEDCGVHSLKPTCKILFETATPICKLNMGLQFDPSYYNCKKVFIVPCI